MNPDLSLRLAAAVEQMPAFPKSVQKILQLTRDVACAPKDLVQVIDRDPVVTVKVLSVVNSALSVAASASDFGGASFLRAKTV